MQVHAGEAAADLLLEACVRHDGVKYFGRAGACVWLAFANPVSKASVLAVFQGRGLQHQITVLGTGGVMQQDALDQEWGVRPKNLSLAPKKEADTAENPPQDPAQRPLQQLATTNRPPAMIKNCPRRQALLKALKKAPGGASEATTGWVDQVDTDAAKLQEDVRTLVDNVYDIMLRMTTALPRADGAGCGANAQADALRESQKTQKELEFMKARHTLQEACITKQRKQINILRSGLLKMHESLRGCKENLDCENILKTLLEHTTAPASVRSTITNKEAIQELPRCMREQEVCEQVLGCITSLHTEIKRLRGKSGNPENPQNKKHKKLC